MNVILRLEYELPYYDPAVHRFNHYTTRTPPILTGEGCRIHLAYSVWLQLRIMCSNYSRAIIFTWRVKLLDMVWFHFITQEWIKIVPLLKHYITLKIKIKWGSRIHRLPLCWGVRPPPNECPGYDTKQSDGEVPAMLEVWGMRSTPLSPSFPGPLWPGVVTRDKGPIYGLNRTKQWLAFIVFMHLNCAFILNWTV